VVRQTGHLRQIAHGGFRRVGLPICVGGERDVSVPSKIRGHIRKFLRIPGQPLLEPLGQIEQNQGNAAEHQHRRAVFRPAHLLVFIHPAKPVHEALDWTQDRVKKGLLPFKNASQKNPNWFCDKKNHQHIKTDWDPAIRGHD